MTPYSLLCDLAACLCAELTPDGAPEANVCFCGVLPGSVVAHEYGWQCGDKCGMAWVRLVSSYAAEGVGVPFQGLGCGTYLGIDIELGVIRCLESEADGEPPSLESMESGAASQSSDMIAMRRAIMCCPALADTDFVLGNFIPTGPVGMVIGGIWTISTVI